MESSPNKTWFEKAPDSVKVVLRILALPILLPFGLIAISFSVLAMCLLIPFVMVQSYLYRKRFWSRIRQLGLMGDWPEVVGKLDSRSGTLLLEMHKKPLSAIWVDRHREAIDPEHFLPSWFDYENKSLKPQGEINEILEANKRANQNIFELLERISDPCSVVSAVP